MKTTLLQTTCSFSHLTSLQYHYFSFSCRQQGLKCSFQHKSEQRHLKLAVNYERISAGRSYHDSSDGIGKLHTRREGLLSLSLSLSISLPQLAKVSVWVLTYVVYFTVGDNFGENKGGKLYLEKSNSVVFRETNHSSLFNLEPCEEIKPDLERYNDEIEGFTLLVPSEWKKVDKAGATVLFEDPDVKSNNIGVVVNPIRISSLKEFGTPQVVADKLLKAEKKKPSTNDARLIKVDQRPINGDIPLYELEYTLDSSRGIKRVLSAVTIASKKLYLLNIAFSDSPEKPLLPDTRMLLEQVLNSFDVLI